MRCYFDVEHYQKVIFVLSLSIFKILVKFDRRVISVTQSRKTIKENALIRGLLDTNIYIWIYDFDQKVLILNT